MLIVEKAKSGKRRSGGRILIHDSSDSELEMEANEGKERKWQLSEIAIL